MRLHLSVRVCLVALLAATPAKALGVGERLLTTTSPTAALRDAEHRTTLRITVWYPAPDGAAETPRLIGPPERPLFEAGLASDDAPMAAADAPWPVVLLSHGFGGSARMMSWFGTELARHGFVVIAVDHPGNSMTGRMTEPGAALWWERAEDLRLAWDAVRSTPGMANRVDAGRLAVAGFSAGGFTALVAAGARVDLAHFDTFCASHPNDGVCRPQVEMKGAAGRDRASAFKSDAMRIAEQQAGQDHAVPGVRGVFVMGPALIQALAPDGLRTLATPTRILLGRDDHVAPPDTNGAAAASLIPHASLLALDGVGHYDFLSTCTEAGRMALPFCRFAKPQAETHHVAIEQALTFFADALNRASERRPGNDAGMVTSP